MLKSKGSDIVEFVGKKITDTELLKNTLESNFYEPFVVSIDPKALEMKLPDKNFTLTNVASILGETYPIKIIEVGLQQQIDTWNIGQYAR